jgi:hypothetical protein
MDRFALVQDVKRYFSILELVPEKVFEELSEDKCWNLFSNEALYMLVSVREAWGKPLIINSKSRGYQFSGYRPLDTSIGAKYSAHRLGVAFDIKDAGGDTEGFYNFILENGENLSVKELEDRAFTIDGKNTPWCHVSVRAHFGKGLRIIKP